mgnify:FL=1
MDPEEWNKVPIPCEIYRPMVYWMLYQLAHVSNTISSVTASMNLYKLLSQLHTVAYTSNAGASLSSAISTKNILYKLRASFVSLLRAIIGDSDSSVEAQKKAIRTAMQIK